jgi:hypothetical protein
MELFTPVDRAIASTTSTLLNAVKGFLVAEQSGAVGADNGDTAIAILRGGECDGIV